MFAFKLRTVVIVGLLMASQGTTLGQPKFSVVGGMTFDFGDVSSAVTVKRHLTIKNVGTDTLVLSNISTSCGCTGTLLTNDHIAPNDSGVLEVSFDPRRFAGRVEKLISMDTNDTTQHHVRIRFTANIIKVLELEPEYLFARTVRDSATSQSLMILNASAQPVRILSAASNSSDITINLAKNELEPGEETILTGTITPKSAGTVSGTIELTTDHPHLPHLSVRYFAWVKDKPPSGTSH